MAKSGLNKFSICALFIFPASKKKLYANAVYINSRESVIFIINTFAFDKKNRYFDRGVSLHNAYVFGKCSTLYTKLDRLLQINHENISLFIQLDMFSRSYEKGNVSLGSSYGN